MSPSRASILRYPLSPRGLALPLRGGCRFARAQPVMTWARSRAYLNRALQRWLPVLRWSSRPTRYLTCPPKRVTAAAAVRDIGRRSRASLRHPGERRSRWNRPGPRTAPSGGGARHRPRQWPRVARRGRISGRLWRKWRLRRIVTGHQHGPAIPAESALLLPDLLDRNARVQAHRDGRPFRRRSIWCFANSVRGHE